MSKLSEIVEQHREIILSSTLLAIDPSSGSSGSMPGYAIFKAGRFTDSGIIKLEAGTSIHSRLFHLRKALTEDFKEITPAILVTENIPGINFNGKFINKSMIHLQKAIGVTTSCFDCPVIEVAPISWRKFIPENYQKSDECDAIMMGLTVLLTASSEYKAEEKLWNRVAGKDWSEC